MDMSIIEHLVAPKSHPLCPGGSQQAQNIYPLHQLYPSSELSKRWDSEALLLKRLTTAAITAEEELYSLYPLQQSSYPALSQAALSLLYDRRIASNLLSPRFSLKYAWSPYNDYWKFKKDKDIIKELHNNVSKMEHLITTHPVFTHSKIHMMRFLPLFTVELGCYEKVKSKITKPFSERLRYLVEFQAKLRKIKPYFDVEDDIVNKIKRDDYVYVHRPTPLHQEKNLHIKRGNLSSSKTELNKETQHDTLDSSMKKRLMLSLLTSSKKPTLRSSSKFKVENKKRS